MTSLRAIVERHLDAFNERDFDAWDALLAEDVEVTVDSTPLSARAALGGRLCVESPGDGGTLVAATIPLTAAAAASPGS